MDEYEEPPEELIEQVQEEGEEVYFWEYDGGSPGHCGYISIYLWKDKFYVLPAPFEFGPFSSFGEAIATFDEDSGVETMEYRCSFTACGACFNYFRASEPICPKCGAKYQEPVDQDSDEDS